jgi:uncharacterized membrane-anchored protein
VEIAMHIRHMPSVNARYWLAITFASLFGTNLGDLYAHNSGLGLIGGLPILAALALAVFLVERRDGTARELYYWLVIIIIRTGATNIADYFKHQIPPIIFGALLTMLFALFAWASTREDSPRETLAERVKGMPQTGATYWCAMLAAGVFGTFLGDVVSHVVGKASASVGLGILLVAAIAAWWKQRSRFLWIYWVAVAVARTAGTAMGDFLAESPNLDIGLPLSTMMTGAVFIAVLVACPRANARSAARNG